MIKKIVNFVCTFFQIMLKQTFYWFIYIFMLQGRVKEDLLVTSLYWGCWKTSIKATPNFAGNYKVSQWFVFNWISLRACKYNQRAAYQLKSWRGELDPEIFHLPKFLKNTQVQEVKCALAVRLKKVKFFVLFKNTKHYCSGQLKNDELKIFTIYVFLWKTS